VGRRLGIPLGQLPSGRSAIRRVHSTLGEVIG
jgi:hypothetical protein